MSGRAARERGRQYAPDTADGLSTVHLKSSLQIPFYKPKDFSGNIAVLSPLARAHASPQPGIAVEKSQFIPESKVLGLIDDKSLMRSPVRVPHKEKHFRQKPLSRVSQVENNAYNRHVAQTKGVLRLIHESRAAADDPILNFSSKELLSVENVDEQIFNPSFTAPQSFDVYLRLRDEKRFMKVDHSDVGLERRLLHKIIGSFTEVTGPARRRPTPSETLSKLKLPYHAFLVLWQETIWSLLAQIFAVLSKRTSQATNHYVERHIVELADLWKQFLDASSSTGGRFKPKQPLVPSKPTGWDALCESEQMVNLRGWSTKDFATRFLRFFDKDAQPVLKEVLGIDTAVLASFVIFRKHVHSSHRVGSISLKAHASFTRFVSQLLPYSSVSEELSKHEQVILLHSLKPADAEVVMVDLREMSANAVSIYAEVAAADDTKLQHVSMCKGQEMRQVRAEMFRKRIGRAVEDQNAVRVDALWKEAHTAFREAVTSTESNIPSNVYAHFLMAFMALRRPNKAIDVWNEMTQNGIPPTVGAWDAMLKGCGKAKDPKSIEAMWQKMIESGIKPDAQVWATRIHGLTTSGYWESGVHAFKTMIRNWATAVRRNYSDGRGLESTSLGDVDGIPKPNTHCLNSLVLGLARGRKHEQLAEVISWAKAVGIKADVYTFNPLFRIALKDGEIEMAMRVLQQMSTLGVRPDIASFTMLLESLFREDDPQFGLITGNIVNSSSPAKTAESTDKHEAAMDIFKAMEQAGIEANAWSFSTLINGLLKGSPMTGTGNIRAAHAVLAHMSENSIPLSSQIYTTLITYHFSVSPPDLAAIESLWNRARTDRHVFLDVVFFDRLIEGLASANEVGRMMTALGQAGKRGKVPGWIALKEVIAALARIGDWDRIEEILAGVRLDEQANKDDVRARKGRLDFWDLAASMGFGGPPGLEADASATQHEQSVTS